MRNQNYPDIPMVSIDGRPWFMATAVCDEIGYRNPSDVIRKYIAKEEVRRIPTKTGRPGNTQRLFISEKGLSNLLLHASKKEKAKQFKNWLTNVVLPTYQYNKGTSSALAVTNNAPAIHQDEKYQRALTIIRNEVLAVRQEQERSRQERQEVMALLRQVNSYFQLSPLNWREAANKAVREVARKKNTKDFSSLYYEMYSEFERDTGVRLAIRYAHLKKKNPKASVLDVIAADKKLVKGFIPVVGAFAMRYGIALNISNNTEKVA